MLHPTLLLHTGQPYSLDSWRTAWILLFSVFQVVEELEAPLVQVCDEHWKVDYYIALIQFCFLSAAPAGGAAPAAEAPKKEEKKKEEEVDVLDGGMDM